MIHAIRLEPLGRELVVQCTYEAVHEFSGAREAGGRARRSRARRRGRHRAAWCAVLHSRRARESCPAYAQAARRHRRSCGGGWRMDVEVEARRSDLLIKAAPLILLDTNAVIWLHRGDRRAVALAGRAARLYASPATILELQFLVEAGRLRLR